MDLQVCNVEEDLPEFKVCYEKYAPFQFLTEEAKIILAKNELTYYDLTFLENQKNFSEFILKQVSIKSSIIMTLWFAFFDLVYLAYNLFDKIDASFVKMGDQKL